MNDSQRDAAGFDQVEAMLVAYAEARLTPSSPVLARMRASVLAAASPREEATGVERTPAARTSWLRRSVPIFLAPRRLAAVGLALALGLGSGAAVLAASPGSPLYPVRSAIETAFLPSNVDARLAAHEDHLDYILADAQAAADRGDSAALAAALEAYQDEVEAAVADVGDDAARLAHLEDVLGKHVAVLESLLATVPTQASIEHAIDTSQNAVNKLRDTGDHAGGKPSQAPHSTHDPAGDHGPSR